MNSDITSNYKSCKQSELTNFPAVDDEVAIDFLDLVMLVWRGRWWIIVSTIFVACLTFAYVRTLPNIYKSEVLLAPAKSSAPGGLSSLVGGLGLIGGLSPGLSQVEDTLIALEVLQSRKFLGEFVDRHSLLVDLMAVESWSRLENQLRYDPSIYNIDLQKWVRDVPAPREKKPSKQEAYKSLLDLVSVKYDEKKGFVRISLEHYSPILAKKWVDYLVEDINSEMQKKEISEATRAIEFLEKRLDDTSVAELKSVFYKLIEEQTKKVMLSSIRDEFAFITIDPAQIPEFPSSPSRLLLVVVVAFVWGVLSVIVAIIIGIFRRQYGRS